MNAATGSSFYCIHPIGGDVTVMRSLGTNIGNVRLLGIQVPKDLMKASFASSIEAVARHHVEALVAYQPKGPISLGGWSVGAVIALEMAQLLVALGREVPLLVAFDGAPCNTDAGLPSWHPMYVFNLLCNVPRWLTEAFGRGSSWADLRRRFEIRAALSLNLAVPGRAHRTMDASAVDGVIKRAGWLPGQIGFFHALYKASLEYVPKPYSGGVLVYECVTQPLFHLRQLGYVWRKLASRAEIVRIKGPHGRFFDAPAIDIVSADLGRRIREMSRDADDDCSQQNAPLHIAN